MKRPWKFGSFVQELISLCPNCLPWEVFDKVYGILGCVDKDNWNNIIQCHANLIATMSPPCQPWSLGGKQQGFQSQNGLHMAYAIRKIRLFSYLRSFWVCRQDCTTSTLLDSQSAFKYAGYFMTWSKVVPMTDFGMQRTRWLATWLRNDLEAKHLGKLILGTVQKMMWNDPLYRFTIPDQIDHQLKLSRELLNVYGNVCCFLGPLELGLDRTPLSMKSWELGALVRMISFRHLLLHIPNSIWLTETTWATRAFLHFFVKGRMDSCLLTPLDLLLCWEHQPMKLHPFHRSLILLFDSWVMQSVFLMPCMP